MPANRYARTRYAAVFTALGAFVPATGAAAHDGGTGGTSVSDRPSIASVKCAESAQPKRSVVPAPCWRCAGSSSTACNRSSSSVTVAGAMTVVRDPRRRSPHRVLVRVPRAARTGPVRAFNGEGGASPRTGDLQVNGEAPPARTAPPAGADDGVFPVRGRHDFGTRTNSFGGGRGHQGQDVFAECGTPVVAARAGKVLDAEADGTQGNFVVAEAEDGTSQAYLHMLEPAAVARGDRVIADDRQGRRDRQCRRVPPALRALDGARSVPRRRGHRSDASASTLERRRVRIVRGHALGERAPDGHG